MSLLPSKAKQSLRAWAESEASGLPAPERNKARMLAELMWEVGHDPDYIRKEITAYVEENLK